MNLNENTQNFAILTPRFARKFSTWNPLPDAEGLYPPNYVVEQPGNLVSEQHFDKLPNLATFQCWERSFKTEVWSCIGCPTDSMLWIKEVEVVDSLEDLINSRTPFPEF